MKILFVCLGNMCRSPMIEQMFADYALSHDLCCECDSAGLMNHEKPMSSNSAKVLSERGIVPRAHVSKLLCAEDVSTSDYIITMTDRLRDKVIEHFGNPDKVLSLSSSDLLGEEVGDPYGMNIDAYRKIAVQFERVMPALAKFIG